MTGRGERSPKNAGLVLTGVKYVSPHFRFLLALSVLALVGVGSASAQTANQVITGYLSTSGCPSVATTPCFIQFGASGGGSGGSVTISQATPGVTNGVVLAPSSVAGVGITPLIAGSAASSQVLKASAGNLYSVYATVTAPSWLMVFNATAAPSNGATTAGTAAGNLQDCISIPSGTVSVNYASGPPEVFSTGITAVISSTACASLTLATTGYIHGSVQ